MEYRQVGRTRLKVPKIGMGCWAIGGDDCGPGDDGESITTIRQDVNLFESRAPTCGRRQTLVRREPGADREFAPPPA